MEFLETMQNHRQLLILGVVPTPLLPLFPKILLSEIKKTKKCWYFRLFFLFSLKHYHQKSRISNTYFRKEMDGGREQQSTTTSSLSRRTTRTTRRKTTLPFRFRQVSRFPYSSSIYLLSRRQTTKSASRPRA